MASTRRPLTTLLTCSPPPYTTRSTRALSRSSLFGSSSHHILCWSFPSTRPWQTTLKSTSIHTSAHSLLTLHHSSGLSHTQPPESDDEEVFTYPAYHQHGHNHDDDDEFVYPNMSVDVTAPPVSLIVSVHPPEQPPEFVQSPDSALESATLVDSLSSPPIQVTVPLPDHSPQLELPLDPALESTTSVDTLPSPPIRLQATSHPSPAQLEALSAAASQGDLPLLKKLFATALQGGDLEAFALANDASSRTGFTALHAAASRGYLDIVKWREYSTVPRSCSIVFHHVSCQSFKIAVRSRTWKTVKARFAHLRSLTASFSDAYPDCTTQSRIKWPYVHHSVFVGERSGCACM